MADQHGMPRGPRRENSREQEQQQEREPSPAEVSNIMNK